MLRSPCDNQTDCRFGEVCCNANYMTSMTTVKGEGAIVAEFGGMKIGLQ
jgi:hypothetical protein